MYTSFGMKTVGEEVLTIIHMWCVCITTQRNMVIRLSNFQTSSSSFSSWYAMTLLKKWKWNIKPLTNANIHNENLSSIFFLVKSFPFPPPNKRVPRHYHKWTQCTVPPVNKTIWLRPLSPHVMKIHNKAQCEPCNDSKLTKLIFRK